MATFKAGKEIFEQTVNVLAIEVEKVAGYLQVMKRGTMEIRQKVQKIAELWKLGLIDEDIKTVSAFVHYCKHWLRLFIGVKAECMVLITGEVLLDYQQKNHEKFQQDRGAQENRYFSNQRYFLSRCSKDGLDHFDRQLCETFPSKSDKSESFEKIQNRVEALGKKLDVLSKGIDGCADILKDAFSTMDCVDALTVKLTHKSEEIALQFNTGRLKVNKSSHVLERKDVLKMMTSKDKALKVTFEDPSYIDFSQKTTNSSAANKMSDIFQSSGTGNSSSSNSSNSSSSAGVSQVQKNKQIVLDSEDIQDARDIAQAAKERERQALQNEQSRRAAAAMDFSYSADIEGIKRKYAPADDSLLGKAAAAATVVAASAGDARPHEDDDWAMVNDVDHATKSIRTRVFERFYDANPNPFERHFSGILQLKSTFIHVKVFPPHCCSRADPSSGSKSSSSGSKSSSNNNSSDSGDSSNDSRRVVDNPVKLVRPPVPPSSTTTPLPYLCLSLPVTLSDAPTSERSDLVSCTNLLDEAGRQLWLRCCPSEPVFCIPQRLQMEGVSHGPGDFVKLPSQFGTKRYAVYCMDATAVAVAGAEVECAPSHQFLHHLARWLKRGQLSARRKRRLPSQDPSSEDPAELERRLLQQLEGAQFRRRCEVAAAHYLLIKAACVLLDATAVSAPLEELSPPSSSGLPTLLLGSESSCSLDVLRTHAGLMSSLLPALRVGLAAVQRRRQLPRGLRVDISGTPRHCRLLGALMRHCEEVRASASGVDARILAVCAVALRRTAALPPLALSPECGTLNAVGGGDGNAAESVDLSSNRFLGHVDDLFRRQALQLELQALASGSRERDSDEEDWSDDEERGDGAANAGGETETETEPFVAFVCALLQTCPRLHSLNLSYCVGSAAQAAVLLRGLLLALEQRGRLGLPALRQLVLRGVMMGGVGAGDAESQLLLDKLCDSPMVQCVIKGGRAAMFDS